MQNRQAFAFFDPIVEAGAAEYEAAGELAGGQKVWILARLPRPIQVTGDDSVLKYLLLVNNHAGPSPGVQIGLTPLRMVCTNMLTVALQLGRGMRFEHRPELHAQLSRAAETLSLLEEGFSEIEANFKRMTQAPMAHRSLLDYLAEVFPEPPEATQENAPVRRLRATGSELFEVGLGNREPGVRGTLWAAYNAVTELVDHYVADVSPESRLDRIWFGEGYEIKARAYKTALRLLKAPHGALARARLVTHLQLNREGVPLRGEFEAPETIAGYFERHDRAAAELSSVA